MKSLIQTVEYLSIQADNLKSTASRLSSKRDWMSQELSERVCALKDLVDAKFDDKLKEGLRVLANSILVSCIITAKENTKEKDWPHICAKSLKYLRTTLKADILIHHAIKDKIDPWTAAAAVAKAKAKLKAPSLASQTMTLDDTVLPDTLIIPDVSVPSGSSSSNSVAAAAEQPPAKKARKVVFKKTIK